MHELESMKKEVADFRDARDWKQFHKPKDMAISLLLEAAEVAELFQWEKDDLEDFLKRKKEDLGDELADVLYWVLLIANDYGIDLSESWKRKMDKNETKYPVDKAKGRSDKYTTYEKS
jgi:dCTP diphosphatase